MAGRRYGETAKAGSAGLAGKQRLPKSIYNEGTKKQSLGGN